MLLAPSAFKRQGELPVQRDLPIAVAARRSPFAGSVRQPTRCGGRHNECGAAT